MHTILAYLIARLGEPSTWRGLFALLTALGISLHPEQMAAITSLGLALIGAVNVFRKEQAVKLLIGGLCVLSMTSCGLTSEQWKNIALTTGKEIGKQLPATAMRAYATEMSKPSGKQPVAVNRRSGIKRRSCCQKCRRHRPPRKSRACSRRCWAFSTEPLMRAGVPALPSPCHAR